MTLVTLRKTVEHYRKQLNSITNTEAKQFELLKGLPFYNWNKPKDQQQGTFVGIVGLPIKNDVTHGFYDYEQQIIDFMETDKPADPKNKHLYILKSSGLGITTLLLYYIGWKCTTNDDWNNGRVCILTAPRLDLTIDLVDRLKAIFRRNDLPPLLQFDSRNTICNINNVKIEAFPSHLGLKGMRGLTDIKMIVCDEASFFDMSQINEARDTIERYWSKSNPIIVLCSTPNRPDDLMDLIRKEPEDKCIYHRMYLDYSVGLDKIYTQEEIALQRLSPSFEREFNLKFAGLSGNVFHTKNIDAAIEKGRNIDAKSSIFTQKSVGLDPSFGSSAFGICITELVNGMINVIYANEFIRADYNQMIQTTVRLLEEYNITFEGRSRIFVDAANPSIIRSLLEALGEDSNYEQKMAFLKKSFPTVYDLELLQQNMFIIPVPFSKYHREMLAHCKKVMECDQGYVAINPKFTKLITSLRTAVEKGDGTLDKEATLHNDMLDAFRLSLQFWH